MEPDVEDGLRGDRGMHAFRDNVEEDGRKGVRGKGGFAEELDEAKREEESGQRLDNNRLDGKFMKIYS